eukprot:scaffold119854_cov69-Phaeocystis_antarctica.AAC.3
MLVAQFERLGRVQTAAWLLESSPLALTSVDTRDRRLPASAAVAPVRLAKESLAKSELAHGDRPASGPQRRLRQVQAP